MANKPVKGIVSVVSKQDKEKGSWNYYDIQLEDGKDYEISLNTEKYPNPPAKGDHVLLWPGKFGQHNYGGLVDPKEEAKYANKSGSTGGSRSSGSNDYWERKFNYELRSKDASLRFQGIFGKVSDIYCAAISQGLTPAKANTWIEKAVAKANEICDTFDVQSGTFCQEECNSTEPEQTSGAEATEAKSSSKTADLPF